jgi:radical SAM protein with 4Fe4S-binding SPASM domain
MDLARPHLANVLFEVTTQCNLECRYCYVPWQAPTAPLVAPREAGFARAERTLARLFRVADVSRVTMTGGEPLLAERLPELVLSCSLRCAAVNVITNGTVGTREDYRQLMAVGARLFELPLLSADPATHDGLTGCPGSWSRVMRSLRDLRDLEADVVAVVVLTRENGAGLALTLRTIADLGVVRVMLNRFNSGGRGLSQSAALAPSVTQLREAFAVADDLAPQLGLTVTSNVGLPHCLVDPAAYRHIGFTSCSADLDRRPLALDADGGLRFCNHSPVVFGNIFDESLAATLDGEYLRRWRTTVPEACADCPRFKRCFGGCRAACEQMGRSLAQVDPLLAAQAIAAAPDGAVC